MEARPYTDDEIAGIRSMFASDDGFNPAEAAAHENPTHTILCWLATVDALRAERDEWEATATNLLNRAERAEAEVERLLSLHKGDAARDAVAEACRVYLAAERGQA